jgi:hypothetical protein
MKPTDSVLRHLELHHDVYREEAEARFLDRAEALAREHFGSELDLRARLDGPYGGVEIVQVYTLVETVEDPAREIAVDHPRARDLLETRSIGDEVEFSIRYVEGSREEAEAETTTTASFSRRRAGHPTSIVRWSLHSRRSGKSGSPGRRCPRGRSASCCARGAAG